MLYRLLALASLAVIAYFSRLPAAEQDLRPFIRQHPVLVRAAESLPHVSFSWSGRLVDNRRDPVDFIYFVMRKLAHIVLYGALGLAVAGALGYRPFLRRVRWLAAALVVLAVGLLDERVQGTTPGRTARGVDVLLDLGSFLMAGALYAVFSGPVRRWLARRGGGSRDTGSESRNRDR
ncbi:MAG: VanZ family protein [Firmicutes bacterium]|nr:VanZ family protein [Bacillota bacterium]